MNFIECASVINLEDIQPNTGQSTCSVKCISCNTVLVSRFITVKNKVSNNSSSVVTGGDRRQILVCPNDNCNCSLGPNKGIYLVDKSDIAVTEEQKSESTDSCPTELSEEIISDISFEFDLGLFDE